MPRYETVPSVNPSDGYFIKYQLRNGVTVYVRVSDIIYVSHNVGAVSVEECLVEIFLRGSTEPLFVRGAGAVEFKNKWENIAPVI